MKKLYTSYFVETFAIAGCFLLAMALFGCASVPTENRATLEVSPTVYEKGTPITVETTKEPTATPEQLVTEYDPKIADSWKLLPVIPKTISEKMRSVYAAGQKGGGLDNHAFSKIGDCETSSDYFLKPFDLSTSGYDLGEYSDLQGVIDQFKGSFASKSLVAQPGFSISSVFSSIWGDPDVCHANEWPIDCEIRVHKPAFALVMFGTNDVENSRPTFTKNLKALVDQLLRNHVVPILATKANNLEGDNSINAIIAQVAYEKDVPLWNYWRAVQGLPNQGLEADKIHLIYAAPNFNDPEAMQAGWPWRNLTALQVLDAVWRGVTVQSSK